MRLKKREQIIVEKLIAAQGRKVSFIQQINLLCEMESECANKIVMELVHEDFEKVLAIMYPRL